MKKSHSKIRDDKIANPFKLKAQKDRERSYLESGELITPFRLLLVLVGEYKKQKLLSRPLFSIFQVLCHSHNLDYHSPWFIENIFERAINPNYKKNKKAKHSIQMMCKYSAVSLQCYHCMLCSISLENKPFIMLEVGSLAARVYIYYFRNMISLPSHKCFITLHYNTVKLKIDPIGA